MRDARARRIGSSHLRMPLPALPCTSNPQGRTYLCKKLDLDARVAVVRPADLKYYTKRVGAVSVLLRVSWVRFRLMHSLGAAIRLADLKHCTKRVLLSCIAIGLASWRSAAAVDSKALLPTMILTAFPSHLRRCIDFTDVAVQGGRPAYAPSAAVAAAADGPVAACSPAVVTVRWCGFRRIWRGTGKGELAGGAGTDGMACRAAA